MARHTPVDNEERDTSNHRDGGNSPDQIPGRKTPDYKVGRLDKETPDHGMDIDSYNHRVGINIQGSIIKETDPLIDRSLTRFAGSDSGSDQGTCETSERSPNTSLNVVFHILMTQMGERLAYYSIVSGLVLYCTSNLGMGQAAASLVIQVFIGFVYLIPVFGGFLADSYLGRYKTIFIFNIFSVIGLLLVPASAVNFSRLGLPGFNTTERRRILFMAGLGLAGLGMGGIKANISPFGAEQVESRGPGAVRSFFNWFYWIINVGALIAYTGSAYIDQEVSFIWGFSIPAISMTLASLVFILGHSKYKKTPPAGSVLTRAFGICRESATRAKPQPNPQLPGGSEKKFLAGSKKSFGGSYDDHLVDGVRSVVKVIPFCFLAVMYWATHAQMSNTFYAQGERMDLRISKGMKVPAPALNASNTICIIILIPIFDKVIYPFFERIGRPLTYLKRIGIGMVLAGFGVAVAGVIEIYRKRILFSEHGSHIQVLAGENFTASNMPVFAQIPQFILIGTSEIFASVTFLEFAYNQAPVAMQGLLTGLFFTACGVGNWVAAAILSIVEAATINDPWWSSDINHAKMENLMFLIAGMILLNTAILCVVSHFYAYQDRSFFEASVDVPECGDADVPNNVQHPAIVHLQEDGSDEHSGYGYGAIERGRSRTKSQDSNYFERTRRTRSYTSSPFESDKAIIAISES